MADLAGSLLLVAAGALIGRDGLNGTPAMVAYALICAGVTAIVFL